MNHDHHREGAGEPLPFCFENMGKSQPFFLGKSVKKSVRERLRYIVRNFKFFQVFFASSLLQSGSPSVLRPCFVRVSMEILYRRKWQQMSTIAPFLYMTAKVKTARFLCPFLFQLCSHLLTAPQFARGYPRFLWCVCVVFVLEDGAEAFLKGCILPPLCPHFAVCLMSV